MITLDTSALIAYFASRDPYHSAVAAVVDGDAGPYYIPVGALAEMTFMIEREFPPPVELAFLADVSDGVYSLHWNPRDIARVSQLIRRYADLSLGFADAAVTSCAEQHGGRLLTLDRRHFDAVARGEGTITVLP